MGAKGFYAMEEGWWIPLYVPRDLNPLAAAESPRCVSMKNFQHASILVSFGTDGPIAPSVITVHALDAIPTPSNHAPINFRYRRYETSSLLADGDVPGAITWTTTGAAGLIPVATAVCTMYAIEIDADELGSGYVGFRLAIGDPAAASICSAICLLSAPRYAPLGTTQAPLYV